MGETADSMEAFAPLPPSPSETSDAFTADNLEAPSNDVGQRKLESVVVEEQEERGVNVSDISNKVRGEIVLIDRNTEHEEFSSDGHSNAYQNQMSSSILTPSVENEERSFSNILSTTDGSSYNLIEAEVHESEYADLITSPAEQFQELPESVDDVSYASLISYVPPADEASEIDQHAFQKALESNLYFTSTQNFESLQNLNGTAGLYEGDTNIPLFFDDNANCGFSMYNTLPYDQQTAFRGFQGPNEFANEGFAPPAPKRQALIAEMPITLSDATSSSMTSSINDLISYEHVSLSNQMSDDIFQVEKDAIDDDCVDFAGLLIPPPSVEQDSVPHFLPAVSPYHVNNVDD